MTVLGHPKRLMEEVIMGRTFGRTALVLAPDQKRTLEELTASRTAPTREVE